ncbi:phosphate/phosphite/phosphonate ABC transporter substrate-binding protein [Tychonema sp. LEGE 07203]|uniref:phosphate/phosphite/phosphonate ABC transporter substrate-binding protein n=1 Tax=Tychonema sp. LEGE 07203 TaxID=1828671 RepID=UPI0018802E01|nr:PhnD/SsuA/transferrin family substrate-binding protein [Tychonema sp. LEGE 07203]MBE9097519.1 PhnD/SsuA/transferrin family substrate-binding protein [Tychonema sp. LEGE 07203]
MNAKFKVLASASAGLLLLGALTATAVEVGQKAIAQTTQQGDLDLRAQAPINRIRIVFANRRDATDLQNKANQVAQILSKEIGMPVDAVIGDETAAVEALRANRADVAFVAGRAALKAEQLAKARMYLAEVRSDYSGGNTYDSVFVVRQDSPLRPKGSAKQTLEQLKGKKMAFASRTSGSGFIFPISELVGQRLVTGPDRLDSFFGNVSYGDGYSSALQAVLRGQADVGAVSEYALLPPWITAEEGKRLRVLQEVKGVPAHGIVIDDRIPAPMRERLINAFMKMNEPANNQLFRSLYNSQRLVKVDHTRHLATLRQALVRAKLEP